MGSGSATGDAADGSGPALPLTGLVVADFSRVLAGPYCTMMLGDLGATVIKVESPAGDDTRHWHPPRLGEESTYFLSVNRNKRSIALDLADPGDRAVALSLATRADVLVENFKSGGLHRFGLDYETVRTANPAVIYTSITGFGSGEGAGLPGYDLTVQALSGMMSLTGDPDGEPMRTGVAVFDVITGLHAAMGILAALRHRDRTGEGQRLELNLLSSALSGLVNQTSAYVAGGVEPTRLGNEHPSLYPYEPFATADGRFIVAVGNDAQFRRLCEVLGEPVLADDERFATSPARNLNRTVLRPLLTARLVTRGNTEWFEEMTAAGIPCAPIQTVAEGVQLAERLGLAPVAMAGEVPTVRHPVGYSAMPARHELPPPALGADGDRIRAWLADDAEPPQRETP